MHISLAAEELFRIGAFPVTNSILTTWIVTLGLIILAFFGTRTLQMVPQGLQNILEYTIESLLKLFENILGDKQQARQFFPLLATLFLFILSANWFGLLPGVGSISVHSHEGMAPVFRPANADLNTTLALAIVTIASIQLFGIAAIGFGKYAGKYLNFSSPIEFFVGILELIGEVSRMISFSFRLFGNIFAGEVLLTVIAFLLPVIAPLPFSFLEIFVGFVQALVFTLLATVFLKIAVTPHEHEEHAEHAPKLAQDH